MPATIATILDDPSIAAVRAEQSRKLSRNAEAARAIWTAKIWGKLGPQALALYETVASARAIDQRETSLRWLDAEQRADLKRVEDALPHLRNRPLTAAEDGMSEEQRAALSRLDQLLPMPGAPRDQAAEQERVNEIRVLGRLAKQPDEAEKLIVLGASVEQARIALTNARASAGGSEISNSIAPQLESATSFDTIAAQIYPKK